jgi:hypothetical protein
MTSDDFKEIKFLRDESAREVAIVPVQDGRKGAAILDKDDIQFLDSLGLSFNWNRLPNGHITAPESNSPNNYVYVSRVLTGAGWGQQVAYIDGDPSNLRRSNLVLVKGHATRRDRDFLKAQGHGPKVLKGAALA